MSAIALVGSVTLVLKEETLKRIILPLVAFAAGSLIGGAFFHMIPAGIAQSGNTTTFYIWILAGFSAFFALEQLLHWHHCHRATASCKRPLTYLILIGDGLHNFIGGLAIAGTFIADIRLGIMASDRYSPRHSQLARGRRTRDPAGIRRFRRAGTRRLGKAQGADV